MQPNVVTAAEAATLADSVMSWPGAEGLTEEVNVVLDACVAEIAIDPLPLSAPVVYVTEVAEDSAQLAPPPPPPPAPSFDVPLFSPPPPPPV